MSKYNQENNLAPKTVTLYAAYKGARACYAVVCGVNYIMPNVLTITFLLFTLLSADAFSCEEKESSCTMSSEFTWNPSNDNVSKNLSRFYDLSDEIYDQYQKGNYEEAKKLISESLELAETYNRNWNYGNAIHDGYRVLGLISLQEGKIDKAAEYLVSSSKSTGSPQLDSFGPEMDLANFLLKAGKTNEVKIYLKGIQSFWDKDNGVLGLWLEKIELGEQPELDRFGSQNVTVWQKIYNWLLFLWPLVFVAAVTFEKRKCLILFKFIPVSIVVIYFAVFVGEVLSSIILVTVVDTIPFSVITYALITVSIIFFDVSVPCWLVYRLSKSEYFLEDNS